MIRGFLSMAGVVRQPASAETLGNGFRLRSVVSCEETKHSRPKFVGCNPYHSAVPCSWH